MLRKVNFAAEFEPAVVSNRRRHKREAVAIPAGLERNGLARSLCKVVDISLTGARLQTYSKLKPKSTVLLSLPRLGDQPARVVWSDDFSAGLEFLAPLHDDEFEQVVAA